MRAFVASSTTKILRACARQSHRAVASTTMSATTTSATTVKETTGIVGLEVLHDAKMKYAAICARILREVARDIPADAGYRVSVEKIYTDRLKATEAHAHVREIEAAIGEGQIEELYQVAEDELGLIPKMRAWKPWEFDHEIEVVEEPKENPYLEESRKQD